MNKKYDMITSKQLMILLITSQIGTGASTLPSLLAADTGHDGWISVILAWFISSIILIIIMALMKRYTNKSILDINKCIFGKYVGTFINILISCYLCLIAVIILRELVEVVHITILESTPGLVVTALFLIPTIYLGWYGVKAFCRFSSIILYILFFIIVIFLLTSKELRLNFIKPVGYAGFQNISKGVVTAFFTFLGIEFPAIFYPSVTDKEKALKYVIIGNSITGIFLVITVFVSIGVFGENMVKHLMFPLFNIPKILRVPFLERMDIYFIILWLPVMGGSARGYFITTFYTIKKIFSVSTRGIYYVFFIIIVVVLSRIPNDYDAMHHYENIANICGIAINIHLVVCYILSFFVKRGIEVK